MIKFRKTKETKEYYWDAASEQIWKLLERNANREDRICEVGCASGHFLFHLSRQGYKQLTGIEIRQAELAQTKALFEQNHVQADLVCANVLDIEQQFDFVFTTGMIQCFEGRQRRAMLEQLGKMAPKVMIVVPEIIKQRNNGSNQEVAVAGCTEYETGSLEWELFPYFDEIYSGILKKSEIQLEDNFLYYICSRKA
jgi:2-polyprenyl-3-methyl-5-hydroxy-6-metoxy-1,4-benzoquinol methylase